VVALTEELRNVKLLATTSYPLLNKHLDTILARPGIASYTNDPSRFPPQPYRFAPQQ